MKFTVAAAGALLLGSALAAPSAEAVGKMAARRAERQRKRVAGHRRTKGNFPQGRHNVTDTTMLHGPTKYVSYDSNWAGVVQTSTGVSTVSASFTNPTVSSGSGESEYGAAYWVGIDGDSCQTAILQTGVSGVIENGQPQYAAWYEWFPDYSYTFSGFEVSAGDVISASVQATSAVSGTATIENQSTGQSVSHQFTNMGSVGSLCQTDAEWIVEDFESGGSLIGFADFGSTTFTSCTSNVGGLSGGTVLDIEQNGQVYTSVSVDSDSQMTINYSG